jgi:cyclomaltodextrinase
MPRNRRMKVPAWARDAVWYQIFPDRFRQGCPRSNPQRGDITDQKVPGWRIVPWGLDWYALDRWEQPSGDFWKTVFLRRYGGDLLGVREQLDYLQDLGVNALYLNPVFQAPSLHKYDASCLHHVDPTLGPDRAGDLRRIARARETEDPRSWVWTEADRYLVELVQDMHARGMRLILDGVFNHAGRGFFAFQDLLAKGRKSRYRDWFLIKRWNGDGTFDYDGWFGHKALPEFARTRNDLAAPVREYIFDITRRWMDPDGDGDPADGIDGWRLDVAFCVPHGFWRAWRRLVKSINPDAYLTAEIVNRADEYLKGDEFDAVMNYMWLYPTLNFFAPHARGIPAAAIRRQLDELRKAYPDESTYVLQNLLDSHDVGRIASMLENAREPIDEFQKYFEASRVRHCPGFVTTRPGPAAYQALRQALVFQMTYVGAPMLYYGTEVGMWGANDPCDRQPMLWEDVAYDDERHRADGSLCRRSPRAPDRELLAFTRRAIALRKANLVFSRGRFRWVPTGHDRLLGYERTDERQRILVLLNASDRAVRYDLRGPARDLWDDAPVASGRITVAARGWRILGR